MAALTVLRGGVDDQAAYEALAEACDNAVATLTLSADCTRVLRRAAAAARELTAAPAPGAA